MERTVIVLKSWFLDSIVINNTLPFTAETYVVTLYSIGQKIIVYLKETNLLDLDKEREGTVPSKIIKKVMSLCC